MKKLYDCNSEMHCIYDNDGQAIYGIASGLTIQWLTHLPDSLQPHYHIDIQAAINQQTFSFNQFTFVTHRAHTFHAYKLSLCNLTPLEEVGIKNLYKLSALLKGKPGAYYLILSDSEDSSHALGLNITIEMQYYLLDPDSGLFLMNYEEFDEYLTTNFEIHEPSVFIKVS
ncbi:hypothetical protein [Candidatus Sororendozoicomonas aggregata]|uniref:hypothetical protein n=1 Tax=Candidatus Sororendozoicomonas aggregata TaxID=3073239 RepID=UPI002ED01357